MKKTTGILVALAVLALVGVGAASASVLASHPQANAYGNGGMNGGMGGGMMGGTGGCGCRTTQNCQSYMYNHTYEWNNSYGMMP